MAIEDKLKEFAKIDGFLAVGVFNPQGEVLAMFDAGKNKIKDIGVLANNVLMNAQRATTEMGIGRGAMIHIEAERANLLVKCLNEGGDPVKTQPGKAHIHLVLLLGTDSGIGLAKMMVGAIITSLAEDFRI